MTKPRRQFLKDAGSIAVAAAAAPLFNMALAEEVEAAAQKIAHLSPAQAAQEEDFWYTVQQSYSVSPNIINLNNGGVSPQPVVVQDALDRFVRIANEGPAYYMWTILGNGRETVRTKLAELSGCSAEEIAMNRNSTEALETIIFGLNLKAGDEMLTTTQDYPNMMAAWKQREKRDGVKVTTFPIPVPCTDTKQIVELYRKALTPQTKVIMICHMINLTGQIMPVKEVCDMAHEHGVEVMVDGAHTFAHLDYKIPDLHCDYYGTSLHKWLCAPFGTGMLWVKKEKIKNLWPLFGGAKDVAEDDIRKFETLGTRSFPAELAIGNAINFHNGIGSKRKEERLRFLKNYWAEKVSKLPKVKLNTSLKPEHSCALANFIIEGMEPSAIQEKLFNTYKIYTVAITHEECKGVRVTPHVYTTLRDLDLLISAVEKMAKG